MKKKHYIVLFLLFSLLLQAQKNYKNFYEVTIFKRLEDKNSSLKIDSLGTIFKNNIATNQKIDLESFNNSIHKLVNLDKNIEKVDGSNEPPRATAQPEKNKQNLYITVVFLKDYYNEKDLGTMTHYSLTLTGIDAAVTKYSWFKYFSNTDLNSIKEYLE